MFTENVRVNIIVTFDITNNQNGKSIMELNQYYFGSDTKDGVVYNWDDIHFKNEKSGTILNLNKNLKYRKNIFYSLCRLLILL